MEQYTQSSQPVRGVVTSAAQTAYTAPYQSAAMDTGAPAVLGAMPPMEQYTQSSQPVRGVVTSAAQTAYTAPYQSAAMDTGAPAVLGAMPPGIQLSSTFPINPHQLAYQQIQQLLEQQQLLLHEQRQLQEQQQRQEQQQQQQWLQEQQLLQEHQQFQAFWASRIGDIEQTTDFKSRCLPLSRIKKIMKADEGVKMISAEVPMVFAKACEMFIMELTLRSWNHTQENKRRTLQKNDIAAAIAQTDLFDFLVDIIPRVESKEESSRIAGAALPTIGAQANSMPYYYVPPQNQVTGAEMIMGRPGDQTSTGGM